jgi:hypothetical protein
MSALDRLKARLQLFHAQGEGTVRTDKIGSVGSGTTSCGASENSRAGSGSFVSPSPLGSEKLRPAANDDGGIALDPDGYPYRPCPTCGGRRFWKRAVETPEGPGWRCWSCAPPSADQPCHACSLPPDSGDPLQDAPPGPHGDAQDADPAPAGPGVPSTAGASPGAPRVAWSDDRGWIARWRTAGPTLPDRLPVARAWIAAAPSPPLPRCLASIEIRRIAAQHGIAVEIAAGFEEFAP